MKMTGELDNQISGNGIAGRGHSWSKSPQACLRNVPEATVAGMVGDREKSRKGRGCRSYAGFCKVL